MAGAPEHTPKGNPCLICGEPSSRHRKRPQHKPEGDPCLKCGLLASSHRVRKDCRLREERVKAKRGKVNRPRPKKNRRGKVFVGVDGEGQGKKNHRYVILAAATETSDREWWVQNPNGLSTVECLDFLLDLPTAHTKFFAFAFNYDLTMILKDVDDKALYRLFRPELRARVGKESWKGPKPVKWGEYWLNLQATKFTVWRGKRGEPEYKRIVIWDIFKFYQSKFVEALKDWNVGSPDVLAKMQLMKDKRAEFDKENTISVLNYCLSECRCMAILARKLVDAHTEVGLKLKSFYGAGSCASAMLKKWNIKSRLGETPEEMKEVLASGFFGGRFENSVIGEFQETIHNWDISSAYPYQFYFLPDLSVGSWEHIISRSKLSDYDVAIVEYSLGPSPRTNWGPFPFRTSDGCISFPSISGGGWVWLAEYLQGERLFPNVEFRSAWVFNRGNDEKPFEFVAQYYKERLKLGKEGAGKILKLGPNSLYGKASQTIGNPEYNSWVWAGMTTSGCRAQLLEVLGLHSDWSNLLMTATDGIYTREKIIPPVPKNTGTFDTPKPLGGWEGKIYNQGVFFARPGIYFPLSPTDEDIKSVRGRGVGRASVLSNWQAIVDGWKSGKQVIDITNVSRFCGAKTCISKSFEGYNRAKGENGPNSPSYGQWITRPVQMSFNPMPKREFVNPDGKTLSLRSFSSYQKSVPYSKALRKSPDAILLALATQELIEQPDVDFTAYE